MTDAIEKAEREVRLEEIGQMIADAVSFATTSGAIVGRTENDLIYTGPLSPLLEVFQEYRSEIEELGA